MKKGKCQHCGKTIEWKSTKDRKYCNTKCRSIDYQQKNEKQLRFYNRQWMRRRREELKRQGNYDPITGWKKNKKYPLGIAFQLSSFSRRRSSLVVLAKKWLKIV